MSSLPAVDSAAASTNRGRTVEFERLRGLLDPAFLDAAGWDPTRQVLTPPAGHPQLGYQRCVVAGCGTPSTRRNRLCASCDLYYKADSTGDFAAFVAAGPRKLRRPHRQGPCLVPGCQRPWQTAPARLCGAHKAQRRARGWPPLEAFVADPTVRPLAGFGGCRARSCARLAVGPLGLCNGHGHQWRAARRRTPELPLAAWCEVAKPIDEGPCAVFRGLPPLLQVQVLFGLQERTRCGYATDIHLVRRLCQALRVARVDRIADLDPRSCRHVKRHLHNSLARFVAHACSSPEVEQGKDVWQMAVFGCAGNLTLDFTVIAQPWLRQAAKRWTSEELPKRRGNRVADSLRDYLLAVAALSDSLRLQRGDRGEDPTALGRADVVAFLQRLAHLHATGRLSPWQRRATCRRVANVLRGCRALGLTRPGQPLAGLTDDVTIWPSDIPRPAEADGPGRALPTAVLRQLVDVLPVLEAGFGRDVRVAVELLIDTGRRPAEVCTLAWDCLDVDADGGHVLVHTDFKANRLRRRLPVSDATARLVTAQQRAIRARFPTTPPGELVLLPRPKRNPSGQHPMTTSHLGHAHRRWLLALPVLRRDDGGEFDKATVVPYAYRHSYAQRHADAGTPVDELRELMGHRELTTTQTYYRVTARRTRAAVDRLAAHQFDGRGNRTWRQARALLEHEHQRRAVGQVAVPFGICTEPSNVQAGGHACPFRFRCVGCGHFRSDPSYLPELRGYLDTLLRNRERVRAAVELDEWARAEATPSDQEVSRLRQLIRRIEADLEQLSDTDRQQIDQACQVVRATRQTVHLGMPTVRPPDPDPALEELT